MTNHEAMRDMLATARKHNGVRLGAFDFIPLAVFEKAVTAYLAREPEVELPGTDGILNPVGTIGALLR